MALVQRTGNTFEGIAFWMENKSSAEFGWPGGYTSASVTREYAITIRELERRTGINFFPNLGILGPTIGRPNLEEDVENTPINWARWPGI
jgi:DNA/RNA endonuclease G (NUC1)